MIVNLESWIVGEGKIAKKVSIIALLAATLLIGIILALIMFPMELFYLGIIYFYILTNPSTNQAGFYRLVKDDVEYVLGKKGKAELLKGTPLYKYDEVNEVVWIPNYLKYNFAKSE